MAPSASTLLNRFVVKAKFRHMQVLLTLSEVGSMRKAAEAVHMTQPAISQLVQELERMLETELFFRHAKGVEPTDAALELLPVARRVLGAIEDGAENLSNRLQQKGGVVRVSASPAAIGGMISSRLDEFASRYPQIQIHLSQMSDTDPLAGIVEKSVNVVCTREPTVTPKGWLFERCVDDMLIAVCGSNHPLASKRSLANEDLARAKWLVNRVGSVARDRFEEVAEAGGWPQNCRCQVIMHIPELTYEMLATGKYLAILPRSVAIPWLKSNDIRELDTQINRPLRPLGFIWQENGVGTATAKFAEFLRNKR